MSQDVPDDRETVILEPVSGSPSQWVNPPSASREIMHAMPYYIVVMATGPVLAWIWWFNHRHLVVLWLAIFLSGFGAMVCLLRLIRGSVLEVEAQTLEEHQYSSPPLHISNRLGQHIKLAEGEILLWESRLHPIKLFAIWGRQILLNLAGGVIAGLYLLAVTALFIVDALHKQMPWWMFALAPLPAIIYIAYTVAAWRCEIYAVTTQRFMAVRGVIVTQAPDMLRAKITDFEVVVPTFAHFLTWLRIINKPFGTWRLETAGQWQGLEKVPFIPDAIATARDYSPLRP